MTKNLYVVTFDDGSILTRVSMGIGSLLTSEVISVNDLRNIMSIYAIKKGLPTDAGNIRFRVRNLSGTFSREIVADSGNNAAMLAYEIFGAKPNSKLIATVI